MRAAITAAQADRGLTVIVAGAAHDLGKKVVREEGKGKVEPTIITPGPSRNWCDEDRGPSRRPATRARLEYRTIRILDRTHGWLWIVEACRDDQVIRCRAERAVDAWTAAAEMAERVARLPFRSLHHTIGQLCFIQPGGNPAGPPGSPGSPGSPARLPTAVCGCRARPGASWCDPRARAALVSPCRERNSPPDTRPCYAGRSTATKASGQNRASGRGCQAMEKANRSLR